MRIKSLALENVRGFSSLKLDFWDVALGEVRPRTVIAGSNGSGKTTILDAIFELLASMNLARSSLFAQADALLVSLKREPIFSSTIPGKIQSYLACARPIIAMLDGEGARIVSDAGAGLTCPAEDAQALADAVMVISRKDKNELVAMGNNGRKYYEKHFDREVLFPQLEGWMQDLTIKGK